MLQIPTVLNVKGFIGVLDWVLKPLGGKKFCSCEKPCDHKCFVDFLASCYPNTDLIEICHERRLFNHSAARRDL